MLLVPTARYVTGEEPWNKEERQIDLIFTLDWKQGQIWRLYHPHRPHPNVPREGNVLYLYSTNQETNLPSGLKVDTVSTFQGCLLCKALCSEDLDHAEMCNIHRENVFQHIFSQVSLIYKYISHSLCSLSLLLYSLLTTCTFVLLTHRKLFSPRYPWHTGNPTKWSFLNHSWLFAEFYKGYTCFLLPLNYSAVFYD